MAVTGAGFVESLRTGITDPHTWTHDQGVASPQGVLVMAMHGTSATDHVVGVTYGGVALARVSRHTDILTEPGAAEIWFKGSGIPTGNQTVSADLASATTDDIHFVSITLDGDGDLMVVDEDGLDANQANPSVTLQYIGKTCMAFAALYSGLTAITSLTAGAGCTFFTTSELSGNFCSGGFRQTTAGSVDFAMAVTAATDDVAYAAIAVSEKVSAADAAAATGIGAATGVAAAVWDGIGGAAIGVGNASAVGAAPVLGVGSAVGDGDGAAIGANLLNGAGVAAGGGDCAAVGAAVWYGVSSAAGAGDAAGDGENANPYVSGDAVSAGVGDAAATGTVLSLGSGAAAGVGATSGVGAALWGAIHGAGGFAIAAAVAVTLFLSAGESAGAAQAVADGQDGSSPTQEADGSASGDASAAADGASIVLAISGGAGSSTVTAVGTIVSASQATASGTGAVEAVSDVDLGLGPIIHADTLSLQSMLNTRPLQWKCETRSMQSRYTTREWR